MMKYFIKISPFVYVKIAALIILIPLPWILAWFAAAIVHEAMHIICVKLLGYQIYGVSIGLQGAVLESDLSGDWQQIFCVMAGPLSGLLLVFLFPILPRLAVCALVQSIFNLLPILPLDGGRICSIIFYRLFGNTKGKQIYQIMQPVLLLAVLMILWIIVY